MTASPPDRRSDDRSFWQRNGRRLVVGIVGFALLAAGMILSLPLVPGPGFLLIVAGLGVLATEFDWADRLRERARQRFDLAAKHAGVDPRKAAIGAVMFLGLLAIGTGVAWYLLR